MKDLENIKIMRKKLNMTQSDLAKKTGVSQSLIAKIESGVTEPSYSNAMKLLDALNDLQMKNSNSASDLMVKKVLTCSYDEDIKTVIGRMKKHGISQLPVMRERTPAGLVTESGLLEHVLDKNIHELKAKDVMQEAPPSVSLSTPETAIINLLRFFPLIAVMDEGKISGIITKADLIKKAY